MAGKKSESYIQTRINSGVYLVELDRPARANAYTASMLRELAAAVDEFEAAVKEGGSSPEVKALLVTSSVPGKFCGGADLDEIAGSTAADAFNRKSVRVFDVLARAPGPTLALIDGPAAGGGVELALACDIRIATPRARFFFPELSLGILPGAGATWRLPRLVGPGLAREMILFGRELDAAEALRHGLVNEVVDPESLYTHAIDFVSNVPAMDPELLRSAREALDRAFENGGGMEFVESVQAILYERNRC